MRLTLVILGVVVAAINGIAEQLAGVALDGESMLAIMGIIGTGVVGDTLRPSGRAAFLASKAPQPPAVLGLGFPGPAAGTGPAAAGHLALASSPAAPATLPALPNGDQLNEKTLGRLRAMYEAAGSQTAWAILGQLQDKDAQVVQDIGAAVAASVTPVLQSSDVAIDDKALRRLIAHEIRRQLAPYNEAVAGLSQQQQGLGLLVATLNARLSTLDRAIELLESAEMAADPLAPGAPITYEDPLDEAAPTEQADPFYVPETLEELEDPTDERPGR